MKKFYFSTFLILFSVSAGNSQTIFQQVFRNDSLMFDINYVSQTYDNGFVMAGSVSVYQLFGSGPGDVLMIRTDSTGNIMWTRKWDLANDEQVFSVLATPDSGFLLAGFTFGGTTLSRDGFILKTDAAGNLLWVKRVDHNGASNTFHSISPARNGQYVYSGRSGGGAGGQYDMYMCLADSIGNMIWGKTFGGVDWDWGWWAEETADGGFIMTGESQSFGIGSNDIYLVKTDSVGNKMWSKVYGSSTFEKGLWVHQDDNRYYIGGYTQGFVPGNTDAKTFLMKTDDTGNPLWFKIYGEMSTPSCVQQTNDRGFILIGSSYNIPGGFGGTDVYVIKTDSAGNVLWSRNYGGSSGDGGTFISQLSYGFLIGGITFSYVSPAIEKAYLIKTDDNGISGCNDVAHTTTVYTGTLTVVIPADTVAAGFSVFVPSVITSSPVIIRIVICTVSVSAPEMASFENLWNAFPNPSFGFITVRLKNTDGMIKSIRLFDDTGKQILIFDNTYFQNEIILDGSHLAAGLYLMKTESEGGVFQADKIIIQK